MFRKVLLFRVEGLFFEGPYQGFCKGVPRDSRDPELRGACLKLPAGKPQKCVGGSLDPEPGRNFCVQGGLNPKTWLEGKIRSAC